MEPCEVAYSVNMDGEAQYHIDTGASSHFINEVEALHNYTPFEVPRAINTAKNRTIQAFGSGTLQFATCIDSKEVRGEFHNVYYIPDIRHRLISVGKLFSQGWEPRLSRNGLTLYDTKECLVVRAPMKNNVCPVTLKMIYPDFGLSTFEEDERVSDRLLHEHLEGKHPLVAFSTEEGSEAISIFN